MDAEFKEEEKFKAGRRGENYQVPSVDPWTEPHSPKGICHVNFMCQLDRAKGCQESFLGVSVRLPS